MWHILSYFSRVFFGWESRIFSDRVPSFTERLTVVCGQERCYQLWTGSPHFISCCGPQGLPHSLLPWRVGEGPCQVPAIRVCCHGNHLGPGQREASSNTALTKLELNGLLKVSQEDMWKGSLVPWDQGMWLSQILSVVMPGCGGGAWEMWNNVSPRKQEVYNHSLTSTYWGLLWSLTQRRRWGLIRWYTHPSASMDSS